MESVDVAFERLGFCDGCIDDAFDGLRLGAFDNFDVGFKVGSDDSVDSFNSCDVGFQDGTVVASFIVQRDEPDLSTLLLHALSSIQP